jgi:hypothetical protein
MASYPQINGVRYDFSSVEINVNGRIVTGVKSINYKNTKKPGAVSGTSAQKNGRTRGKYEPEAGIEMYRQEADELRAALGNGYMEVAFDIVVHYADDGQPTVTDRIRGCLIADESFEGSEGSDALTVKFELDVIAVLPGGLSPLRTLSA